MKPILSLFLLLSFLSIFAALGKERSDSNSITIWKTASDVDFESIAKQLHLHISEMGMGSHEFGKGKKLFTVMVDPGACFGPSDKAAEKRMQIYNKELGEPLWFSFYSSKKSLSQSIFNSWNSDNRHIATAYFTSDNTPALRATLNLDGGVTAQAVEDFFIRFIKEVNKFNSLSK